MGVATDGLLCSGKKRRSQKAFSHPLNNSSQSEHKRFRFSPSWMRRLGMRLLRIPPGAVSLSQAITNLGMIWPTWSSVSLAQRAHSVCTFSILERACEPNYCIFGIRPDQSESHTHGNLPPFSPVKVAATYKFAPSRKPDRVTSTPPGPQRSKPAPPATPPSPRPTHHSAPSRPTDPARC